MLYSGETLQPSHPPSEDAMTSELNQHVTEVGTDEKLPDFPPRDDMWNYSPSHLAALDRHFGMSNAVAVLADTHYR